MDTHWYRYTHECPHLSNESPKTNHTAEVSCLWCFNRLCDTGVPVRLSFHDYNPQANRRGLRGEFLADHDMFGDFNIRTFASFSMNVGEAWYDNAAEKWMLKTWARREGILC